MASPYVYSAALYYFMRRTTISHFSFLIREKLSFIISGRSRPTDYP